MKYFVFCAANIPENQAAIANALKAVEILRWEWSMNATVTGIYEGSVINVNPNDGNNTSVCVEDDSQIRLIQSCMAFAREMTELKYKNNAKAGTE